MQLLVDWIAKHPASALLVAVTAFAVAYVAFNHEKLFYRE